MFPKGLISLVFFVASPKVLLPLRDPDVGARMRGSGLDREQIHQLSADTLIAAMAYLPDVVSQEYLFPGRRTKRTSRLQPMDQRSINDRIRTLGNRIGLPTLSPHDLRHYWATVAMRNKTSVDRLQEAGGWASPIMPLRYANRARIANEGVNL